MNCRYLSVGLLVLFFICTPGVSDSYGMVPGKGSFLIAGEDLVDPRFRNRVILLIQHDIQGSAGLVVNRTSRLPLAAMLPEGSLLASEDAMLSYGGPVDPKALLALVKVRNNPPAPADEIFDSLYVTGVDVLDDWAGFADEVVRYRVFVGYTGWASGQLEAEVERGDWQILAADEESIFAGNGDQLWEDLRQAVIDQN